MVVCFAIGNLERDDDLRKEGLERERLEVTPGVEAQAIDPGRRRAGLGHQRPLPAVRISRSATDQLPLRFMLPFEDDLDTSGRNAARRIEDVGGDRAHERGILAQSPEVRGFQARRFSSSRPDDALGNCPSSKTTTPRNIVLRTLPSRRIPAYGVTAWR